MCVGECVCVCECVCVSVCVWCLLSAHMSFVYTTQLFIRVVALSRSIDPLSSFSLLSLQFKM